MRAERPVEMRIVVMGGTGHIGRPLIRLESWVRARPLAPSPR